MSQKITSFDKQNLKSVREEIDVAMAKIVEKYGLQSIHLGTIRFQSNEFSARLTATCKSSLIAGSQNQSNGFPNVGDSKFSRQTNYTVTAIVTSRPKYPISCRTQNGANYKMSLEQWNSL